MSTSAIPISPAPSAASYLRQRAAELLPRATAVQNASEIDAGVWQITCSGGRRLVAKYQPYGWHTRDTDCDLLAVERQVLDLLVDAGCPVPRVLGIDPEMQFIFFEHRGDVTLDDLCQENAGGLGALARRATIGFCQIEGVLARREAQLRTLVHPAATAENLRHIMEHLGEQAHRGLEYLLPSGGDCAAAAPLHDLLDAVLSQLAAGAISLGSTDYNARNIVVDAAARPTFIEFAKIGWDWPERRLVQYLTSLGAGRDRGKFHSLVDRQVVQLYAHCQGGDDKRRVLALDGHHIAFCLNAAALLGSALKAPQQTSHARLLQRWRQPQERMRQLVQELSKKLSDAVPADEFRNLLHRVFHLGGAHR